MEPTIRKRRKNAVDNSSGISSVDTSSDDTGGGTSSADDSSSGSSNTTDDFGTATPAPTFSPGGERVKRRGRPPGSGRTAEDGQGRKTRRQRLGLDVKVLGTQLVGAHQILALCLDAPLACITSDEGESLAEPIVAICEYYGLKEVGAWMLWVHLVTAMAMVYGPKVVTLTHLSTSGGSANVSWPDFEANITS